MKGSRVSLKERWGEKKIPVKYLTDRGYRITEDSKWNLPHSRYKPTELEMEAMYYLSTEFQFGGYSDQTKMELNAQKNRPFWCKIGLHKLSIAQNMMGPRTAIEMHQRSGAIVMVYHGPWRTCVRCGHQQFGGDTSEQ